MREFDLELRDKKEWRNWAQNRNHLYAIQHAGKLYPVKKVLSLATGISVREFYGGITPGQANDVASAAGFAPIRLRHRNPDWTRDELILALDLYLRHRASPPGKDSQEVVGLSAKLNRLASALHGETPHEESFRNLNGVYMKLMNFRRLDPEYTAEGKKGLQRGNADEEIVWREYASDPERCRKVADAIVRNISEDSAEPVHRTPTDWEGDLVEEAPEGSLLTSLHIRRERNRKLVHSKRKAVLRSGGQLVCEGCGFDFQKRYGARGQGYIECHHTRPLDSLEPGSTTHIRELALVCSNCHRIIHRYRPWLTMEQLRAMLS